MTQLRELWLDGTQITDDGLVHLAGMSRLQWLSLGGTQITDNGLVHFKGMARLRYVSLDGTNVTNEGVKKLQQALPNCDIVWSPPAASPPAE